MGEWGRVVKLWRLFGSLLLISIAAVALGACAASTDVPQAGSIRVVEAQSEPEPDVIRVQLDWLPNTNHTGIYVAMAQGWYEEEGIEIEILPYSGAAGEILLDQDVADVAFSFPTYLPFFRAQGFDIVSIAAVLQTNPTEVAVLADGPITRPRDLDGQIYGGFGGPAEQSQWEWVVRADGGQGDISGVILDTAAYEALYEGRVQAVEPFVTWEGIEAKQRGIELRTWKYTDFGIPDYPGTVLVAARALVDSDPDLLTRFLAATIKGYEYAVSEPNEAAQMMIDIAGEDVFPNLELVFESARLLAAQYYVDPEGRWGSQTLEQWEGYAAWLFEQGLLLDVDGDPLVDAPITQRNSRMSSMKRRARQSTRNPLNNWCRRLSGDPPSAFGSFPRRGGKRGSELFRGFLATTFSDSVRRARS